MRSWLDDSLSQIRARLTEPIGRMLTGRVGRYSEIVSARGSLVARMAGRTKGWGSMAEALTPMVPRRSDLAPRSCVAGVPLRRGAGFAPCGHQMGCPRLPVHLPILVSKSDFNA
ncbi:hypothetical protein PSP6_70196 [Paraburkholderia tropica]|nr:hypothetical protein PSP6_70196 [Paraburkholderia tropica]